jgi:hypothetical protein
MSNNYDSSDLGTAAFLVVKGLQLLGATPDAEGRRYLFRFVDPHSQGQALAMAYQSGEAVPARDIVAAEKNLKSVLYSVKGNGTYNGNKSNDRNKSSNSLQ